MTHKFKNVSPLGDLDIPVLLRGPVEAGEIFEVPDDMAEYFAEQSANYEEVGDDVPTTAEVRAQEAADAEKAQAALDEKAAASAAKAATKEAGQ